MGDLERRFRALDEARPRDLWPEIREREPGRVPGPNSRTGLIAVAALVIAAGGMGLAVWAFTRGAPGLTPVTPGAGGSVVAPSATPTPPTPPSRVLLVEGRIAFVRRGLGTPDSVIYLLNGQEAAVSRLALGYEPALSPDGTEVAFRRSPDEAHTEIDVMNADGTGMRTLVEIVGNPLRLDPAWSPDGREIVFASHDGLYVMDADGSDVRRLTREEAGGPGQFYVAHPSWSPDGSKIAFARDGGPAMIDASDGIWVVNSDGTDLKRLSRKPPRGVHYLNPSWSPDGQSIAFDAGQYGDADVFVMHADGSHVANLTKSPGVYDTEPAWSPEGDRIAFASGRGGNLDIYMMDPDGSDLTRLTDEAADQTSPTWAP